MNITGTNLMLLEIMCKNTYANKKRIFKEGDIKDG